MVLKKTLESISLERKLAEVVIVRMQDNTFNGKLVSSKLKVKGGNVHYINYRHGSSLIDNFDFYSIPKMTFLIDDFETFLSMNINQKSSEGQSVNFKEGIVHQSFLYTDPALFQDPTDRCRFEYVRNLCMKEPVRFTISEAIGKYERALMLLSFNDVKAALNALDTSFECEVIGTDAITRTGSKICTQVLVCKNTSSQEMVEYSAEGYKYPNFAVQPLQHNELLYCYVKMVDIYRNEDNEQIKRFRLRAYLNRVLMKENSLNANFIRAFLLVCSEIDFSIEEAEKIIDVEIPVNDSIFQFPISFKGELMINTGLAYKNRYYFKEAYECLLPYPLFIEKIDCLIGMRRSEEAAAEISKYISLIRDSRAREDRMMLCELYIKLAHLFQDSTYFDRACEAFNYQKPYYLKGLFHFKRKEYKESILALENALKLSPGDWKIRFAYGCVLIELERICDALEVFKVLKTEEPMNQQVAKNLSYCYYKLDDIENTLESLKKVALSDESSMNQLFVLSIKNNKIENIKWALGKICSMDLAKGGVSYVLENRLMDANQVRTCLEINPYFDKVFLDEILKTAL